MRPQYLIILESDNFYVSEEAWFEVLETIVSCVNMASIKMMAPVHKGGLPV